MLFKKRIHISTYLSTIIHFLEQTPITLGGWIAGMSSWILLRFFLENWLSDFPLSSGAVVPFFLNLFFSFWFSALLFVWFIARMARVDIGIVARVMLFGFGLILTPPLVDYLVFQGKGTASFYVFDGLGGWSEGHGLLLRFLTFFGDRPDFGITYGVRTEVALFTLLMAGYVWWKTRGGKRLVATLFGTYGIFFVLGTLPSWLTIIFEGWSKGFASVTEIDIVQIFLTPQALFSLPTMEFLPTLSIKMSLVYAILLMGLSLVVGGCFFPKQFWSMVKNARFPQLFYHSGLVCVGMGLALLLTDGRIEWQPFTMLAFIVIQMAVWAAWLAAVVVNDCFDTAIDAETNASRPLPQRVFDQATYRTIGWLFFGLSLLFALSISLRTAVFLLMYQMVSWMYSAHPLRLKRFPWIGTFVAAVASWFLVLLGFSLIAPNGSVEGIPALLQWFFLIAFMSVLPIKDFKDRLGDKKDGVWTIPVVFGERTAKKIIGVSIWLVYAASIVVFRESRLTLPSFFLGMMSFVVVMQAAERGRVTFRNIFWWILAIAFVYGLFVVFYAVKSVSN